MAETVAARFQRMHREDGCFLMPNAWDAVSAALLAGMGFPAIGTTSAGLAFAHGVPDAARALTREQALENLELIARAVDAPVNADFENGYGDSPEDVAETVRLTAAAGAAGIGIEDYTGDPDRGFYARDLAVERIRAAVEAAEPSGLVVTGRTECFLLKHPEPMKEAIDRLNRFREAGAHCLYAPAVRTAEDIATLIRNTDGPHNILIGIAGMHATVSEMAALGAKRLSTGGSMARYALAALRRAGEQLLGPGPVTFPDDAVPHAEVEALFKSK